MAENDLLIGAGKKVAKSEGNKLMKWIKDGPMALKVLSFLGALGSVVVGCLHFVSSISTFSLRNTVVHLYIIIFALVALVLEGNNMFLTAGLRKSIEREVKLLTRLWGRGWFYIFIGTLLLTTWKFLSIVAGAWMTGVGVCSLIVSKITSRKLNQLRGTGGASKSYVKGIFKRFDTDNSGYLQRAELANLLGELGTTMSDNEVDAAMDVLDPDHTGKIQFETFYIYWTSSGDAYV